MCTLRRRDWRLISDDFLVHFPSSSCVAPLDVYLLDLEDHALTPDPIEDTRVIHRHILFSDRFDDFLRHDPPRQGADVV